MENAKNNCNVNITGNTYRTEDYSIFKRLAANRPVLSLRVNKIIRSISTKGYIYNPIVVNEKYEVIDGQGRLEALSFLGLPVDFVIAPGAGLDECRILNTFTTRWSTMDYIESFRESGNDNYIRMKQIIDDFPTIKLSVKILIATGRAAVPTSIIQEGKLVVEKDSVSTIYSDLSLIAELMPYIQKVSGRQEHICHAIAFAHHCGTDEERLLRVLSNNIIPSTSSAKEAMNYISDIYNRGLRDSSKKIYLYPRYETEMCDKFGWYGAKYGCVDEEVEDDDA